MATLIVKTLSAALTKKALREKGLKAQHLRAMSSDVYVWLQGPIRLTKLRLDHGAAPWKPSGVFR
jgi:hypothetical protein